MKYIILILLVLLVGCVEKEISYTSTDEAMKIKFNESIHQIKKCSISIYGGEEYLSFAFFGECGHIKRECTESDICDWSISNGAHCYKDRECYPNYTGRCVCSFKDDN